MTANEVIYLLLISGKILLIMSLVVVVLLLEWIIYYRNFNRRTDVVRAGKLLLTITVLSWMVDILYIPEYPNPVRAIFNFVGGIIAILCAISLHRAKKLNEN